MDGFVHGKLEQDARTIDPGNPRRFLRSIKGTKAMDGFVPGKLAARMLRVLGRYRSRASSR
jgi:hypothetical protein